MDYINGVKNIIGGKNLKALINTYGCQQNESDSEKISGLLSGMGYEFTADAAAADFIIFNTCAVRENAEKKVYGSIGAVKLLKEEKPDMVIAVSGCMAQEAHTVKRIKSTYKQVDLVFGANNIHKLPRLLYEVLTTRKRVFNTEYEEGFIAENLPVNRIDGIKAGVPVMYGCNNFCSYCIVPYVRGRERSRSESDILNEINTLAKEGYKEVMLLGQNVNSYDRGGDDFARLLEKVSDTGIERIRFMTSHPKDISDKVIEVMAKRDNICKCLHLPVQAGNNKILKLMNRRYTRESYLEIIDKAKEKMPDITLTSDIIVGFPGEGREEFSDTLSLLERVRFDTIYSFIFSKRQGTPACDMADVIPEEEKKQNFNDLLEIQNQISYEKNKRLTGKTLKVLTEGESKTNSEYLTGRTEGNKIVNFKGDKALAGNIIDVKIKNAKTWNLEGEI